MLKIRDEMGWVWEDAAGGVWTSPKWGREKLQPQEGQILCLAMRWGSSTTGSESGLRSAADGNTECGAEPGARGTPGAAVPAGSGEEERRISAPSSICWRTWPAPRQAENSTHVRTRTQRWLCPRRALPSCCAPRSAPASACACRPRSPLSPPPAQNAP